MEKHFTTDMVASAVWMMPVHAGWMERTLIGLLGRRDLVVLTGSVSRLKQLSFNI